MAYNITLSAGKMAVTFDNGDTAIFNLTTDVSAKVERYRRFEQVPDPSNDPAPLATSITIETDYSVKLRFNDDSYYDIRMGEVDNQGTWLNTQAGANACVAAILTNLA